LFGVRNKYILIKTNYNKGVEKQLSFTETWIRRIQLLLSLRHSQLLLFYENLVAIYVNFLINIKSEIQTNNNKYKSNRQTFYFIKNSFAYFITQINFNGVQTTKKVKTFVRTSSFITL